MGYYDGRVGYYSQPGPSPYCSRCIAGAYNYPHQFHETAEHDQWRSYHLNQEVNVMAPQLPEGVTIELSSGKAKPEVPAEYFHEGTMGKVFDALVKSGLTNDQALDGMREMQNAGILFRERFKI